MAVRRVCRSDRRRTLPPAVLLALGGVVGRLVCRPHPLAASSTASGSADGSAVAGVRPRARAESRTRSSIRPRARLARRPGLRLLPGWLAPRRRLRLLLLGLSSTTAAARAGPRTAAPAGSRSAARAVPQDCCSAGCCCSGCPQRLLLRLRAGPTGCCGWHADPTAAAARPEAAPTAAAVQAGPTAAAARPAADPTAVVAAAGPIAAAVHLQRADPTGRRPAADPTAGRSPAPHPSCCGLRHRLRQRLEGDQGEEQDQAQRDQLREAEEDRDDLAGDEDATEAGSRRSRRPRTTSPAPRAAQIPPTAEAPSTTAARVRARLAEPDRERHRNGERR